jgi:hypothetical protein
LAIPVDDLEAARRFYIDVLQCREGRSDRQWVDFDFFGHQLVAHKVDAAGRVPGPAGANPVDGHQVPVPHFGVVLDWARWQALADRLTARAVEFIIEPGIRFQGQVGEQATMFIRDPAENVIEFKAFKDPAQLFATAPVSQEED